MSNPCPSPHTGPWVKKSILSIDGGGIRAYSSLVIVQALMKRVGEIEQLRVPEAPSSICSSAVVPLDDELCTAPTSSAKPISGYWPCHYFDYIAGVGTGGIIAMLLGRCRMSVGEAMERYRDICTIIVGQSLTSSQRKPRPQEPVSSTNHKTSRSSNISTMELVPAWGSLIEHDGNLESDPNRCRTIVCGYDPKLQLFRSYSGPEERRYAINDVISRCVRPKKGPEAFWEAKYYYTNPSRTVLAEVLPLDDQWPSEDDGIDLLSIGAGIHEPANPDADRLRYQRSKQTQRVHEEISSNPSKFLLNQYCRIDPLDHSLDDIGGNEFQSNRSLFRRIEKATNLYLQNETTAKELDDFAEALVEKRRLRAETMRWERWTLGVCYRCPMFKCVGRNQLFEDKVGFWAHLSGVHGVQYLKGDRGKNRVYEVMGRTREGIG